MSPAICPKPVSSSSASFGIRVISISPASANGSGALRAHADVELTVAVGVGSLLLRGFSVIEKDGKPPWVSFPQRQGSKGNKWFPIVEAQGKLRQLISEAVLDAYANCGNGGAF